MKKSISRLYFKIIMGYHNDSWLKGRLLSVLKYFAFPEFRKNELKTKKYIKYSAIFVAVYIFGAIVLNNVFLMNTVSYKDSELKNSYKEISNLYNNAKSVVFEECMDSVNNTEEYIRFMIYSKSGIIVPKNVPAVHLALIKKNSEIMGIPLSIYVRVINHESGFDSSAVNSTSGAFGYMQLMPGTFKHFYDVLSLKGGNTSINNLICGSSLLKQNFEYWYKRRNDRQEAWEMALACYAMGDSIPRAIGRVPDSVKDYVNYVMKNENF